MKMTKQIVVAGVAALALLAMPAGLNITPAGSTAYAASNTPQPIKAPTSGTTTAPGNGATTPGTVITPGKWPVHTGSTARYQGFSTGQVKGTTDATCQHFADDMEAAHDRAGAAAIAGDTAGFEEALRQEDLIEDVGLDAGCAFIY